MFPQWFYFCPIFLFAILYIDFTKTENKHCYYVKQSEHATLHFFYLLRMLCVKAHKNLYMECEDSTVEIVV